MLSYDEYPYILNKFEFKEAQLHTKGSSQWELYLKTYQGAEYTLYGDKPVPAEVWDLLRPPVESKVIKQLDY